MCQIYKIIVVVNIIIVIIKGYIDKDKT
jgi:hypothetical protein